MSSTSSIASLALPHVAQLHAYTPGLQPTGSGWVKLNTNESGYPPSPKVAEAIRAELGELGHSLRLYPNPSSAQVREAVAAYHGSELRADHVFVGNGSDDVLNVLVRCFGGPTVDTGFTFPSYSLYPVLVGIQDGRSQTIPFDRSMALPVDAMARSTARAFFLTSPNAPTGVAFSNTELEEVLVRFPGILVVDEAYAPFAEEDATALLARYPRLVIVRTLSKAHALAGIRVGYALAHPEVVGLLDRVRDSYNVSRLSQVAAVAALGDSAYYDALIQKIKATRDHYRQLWTQQWGWFSYRSATNFIFVEPKTRSGRAGPEVAKTAYDALYQKKILVRAFPNHPLTAPFLRISVGTDAEMATLNQALLEWHSSAQ